MPKIQGPSDLWPAWLADDMSGSQQRAGSRRMQSTYRSVGGWFCDCPDGIFLSPSMCRRDHDQELALTVHHPACAATARHGLAALDTAP
jgi:hypothetical protein